MDGVERYLKNQQQRAALIGKNQYVGEKRNGVRDGKRTKSLRNSNKHVASVFRTKVTASTCTQTRSSGTKANGKAARNTVRRFRAR